MLSDLYSDALLDAAADIPPKARIDGADAVARKSSKVCGSEVTVALRMHEGAVAEMGLDVKACALGQASASIMARAIIGATPSDLRAVREAMVAMLKDDGPVPAGERWGELEKLLPIKDYPARHASTLLVFDAVVACLDQIDAAP